MSECQVEMTLSELARRDQVARRQRLDGNLSREALVTFDAVFDHDPAHPRFEQRAHREPAAPIGQGDDNAIGAQVGDDRAQPRKWTGQTRGIQDVALVEVVDDAGQTLPPGGSAGEFLDQLARQLTRPDDQHPLGGSQAPDHARPHQQQHNQRRNGHCHHPPNTRVHHPPRRDRRAESS